MAVSVSEGSLGRALVGPGPPWEVLWGSLGGFCHQLVCHVWHRDSGLAHLGQGAEAFQILDSALVKALAFLDKTKVAALAL